MTIYDTNFNELNLILWWDSTPMIKFKPRLPLIYPKNTIFISIIIRTTIWRITKTTFTSTHGLIILIVNTTITIWKVITKQNRWILYKERIKILTSKIKQRKKCKKLI